jgi:hypothetical protein
LFRDKIFTVIVFCGVAPDTIFECLTFSDRNSLLLAETDGILIVFFNSATVAIFIIFLSVSGGISPFWAGNRYRTMAKTLRQQLIPFYSDLFKNKTLKGKNNGKFEKNYLMVRSFALNNVSKCKEFRAFLRA